MSYITKTIGRHEKLLMITRVHWIYLAQAAFWFVLLSFMGFLVDHFLYLYAGHYAFTFHIDLILIEFTERNTPIPWLFVGAGAAMGWPYLASYLSIEIGLTDQRIICKRGLIFIRIDQFDLEDIRSENVVHGWLGWLLGYGEVELDCRFVDDVSLPAIPDPYRLIKASHAARMKNITISYTEDEFYNNVERMEKQRKEAEEKHRLRRMASAVKRKFKKAS